MKSSIKKNTFKAIYRLLDKVSPVNGDCGLLCGSICCTYEYENADYSNIDDAARTATDSSSSTGDAENGGHPEAPDAVCCSKGSGNDDFSLGIYLLPGENSFPVTRNGSAGAGHTPRTTNSPTAGTGKCISCDVSMHLTATAPCVLCSAGRSLWPLTSMKTASFA